MIDRNQLQLVVAHGYRSLKMKQIWKTIVTDVPQLQQLLSQFVQP